MTPNRNLAAKTGLRIHSGSLLLAVVLLSWTFIYEDTFGDLPIGILAGGCILVLLIGRWRLGQYQVLGCTTGARIWEYLRHLWFAILLSWAYGIALGWYLENPPGNIVRNFFGLTLYAFVPLFICARISTRQVINVVTFGAIVQSLWSVYAVLSTGGFGRKLDLGSWSDYRSIYSTGFICIFPLFSLVLALNVFLGLRRHPAIPAYLRQFGGNPIALILVGCLLVVPSMSKGFILAAVMLGTFISFAAILEALQRRRVGLWHMGGLALVFSAGLYFAIITYSEWDVSFSSQEPSNLVRKEQAAKLAAEFEWMGNGLGARLKSGYARDDAGYGFELTYLNLVHKLGLAAVPIFLLYAGTVGLAARLSLSARTRAEGVVALGAMCYLVVGAGNPLLLSATAVSLHLLALVLIENGFAGLASGQTQKGHSGLHTREVVHA